jgi:predicted nucleic-acid-binding protein
MRPSLAAIRDMRGLDTNVLVRYITADDAIQADGVAVS